MSHAVDPPASRQPLRIPSDQLARQAVASLGGHLFQATRAATEWSHLGDDARLLIEVAEDYAVLVRDALDIPQTKHEFGASVTRHACAPSTAHSRYSRYTFFRFMHLPSRRSRIERLVPA